MDKFLSITISGIVSGGLYALLAAGLVVSFNATGIFSFGYGAVAFTCAFLFYELHSGLGWPVWLAAIVTVGIFAPLLGVILDRLVFRRLANAPDAPKVVASIGVLIALPALARWIVELLVNVAHVDIPLGNNVYIAPGVGPSPAVRWKVGSVMLTSDQVIIFGVALLAAGVLWLVLRRTRLGLHMRAVVARPDLAQMRGVDHDRVSTSAWILGTVLAGLAGVVGAPIFNSLDPGTYTLFMFVAISATVVGRLHSIPIAVLGGLGLGVLQNWVAGYAGFAQSIPGFSASVPFVVLLIGLLAWGGDSGRRAGVASEGAAPFDYLDGVPTWRRILPWCIATALLIAYFFVANRFWLNTVTLGLALALIFLSFVVVTGLGGMVSLAQAAFVTVSALTVGMLIGRYDVPYLLALFAGVAVAAALGVVVALPALRVGGLALALATLALGFLGDRVLFQWAWLSNLQDGWAIPRPALGPIDLEDARTMALVLLALVALVAWLIRNLHSSASGRAMLALRASEPAAASSGLSPAAVKLRIFALSAALAGLGGGLLATLDKHTVNSAYPTSAGLLWLAAVVLWGVRRPGAAIVAGMSAAIFPQLLAHGVHFPSPVPTFLNWEGTTSIWVPAILFGFGAIQMAKDPDGILAVAGKARHAKRTKAAELATEAATDSTVIATPESVERMVAPLDVSAPARSTARPTAALELLAVESGYGDITVLRGVDLDLMPGTITALFGANGAGKSTLVSTIAGMIPTSSGEICFEGEEVQTLPAFARARRELLTVPESRGIFATLSVEENLSLRLTTSEQRDAAYDRFPVLKDRRTVPAGNLSGGEQQMLGLAPILIAPPKVLVADEPMLGLAPRVVAEILEIFVDLRSTGVAILLVEEKARTLLDIADRVALLELGRISWRGPRSEFDEAALTASYLGVSTPVGVTDGPAALPT